MNYRHGFHAGNFVDCTKHLLLVALLQALQRKDAPYACIESHAGAGLYALDGPEARATGEAASGIQRVRRASGPRPPAAEAWLAVVEAFDPGAAPRAELTRYPGSPLLIARLARPRDRAVFCELLTSEADRLAAHLGPRERVEVGDGYEKLKGLIPPPERRGLVFIDPPYESGDEPRRAAAALRAAAERWPSGVLALWYPIKEATETAGLLRRVASPAMPKTLCIEFQRVPVGRVPGLIGSGLVVVNPPYRFEAEAAAALAWLGGALKAPEAQVRVDWLVPER